MADITFAVWQYYLVAGDRDFRDCCGYEIILETVRFWAGLCAYNFTGGRDEIGNVIDLDEYKGEIIRPCKSRARFRDH